MMKILINILTLIFLFLVSIGNLQISIINSSKILYYIVFGLLFFIAVLTVIKQKNTSFPSNSILVVISLLLIWKFIVLFYTPFIKEGVINILDFIVIILASFFVFPNILKMYDFIKQIYVTSLIICFISIVGSLYIKPEKIYFRLTDQGYIIREGWLFNHPNMAGLYGVVIFISSFLLFSKFKNKVFIVSLIGGISLPFITNSRTSIVIIFGFLILFYFWKKKLFIGNRLFIFSFYGVGILCSSIIIFLASNSLENINKIFSNRMVIWENIFGSMNNKIIGEGLFIQGNNLIYSVDRNGFGLDGLFISYLYNEGFIGISLFIIFILLISSHLLKKSYNNFSIVLLISALIFSLTESHFFIVNNFTFLVLCTIAFQININRTLLVRDSK